MAGASVPIDTGGGGISPSSSAASTSGDIRGGNKAYGGINIAPGSSGFSIPPMTIAIAVGVTGLYFFAKKKNYI